MTREEHRRKVMAERRRAKQRKMRNRRIVLTALLVVLVAALSIGGTVAWLTATTPTVTNTFTTSDINITLAESENLDLKMIPGHTITKDPKVTVVANSEKCYLFVKVEESDNFGTFMTYDIADGWTQLEGVSGVYYREVDSSTSDQVFDVIKDNQVTVNTTVTKAEMNALTDNTRPTLTFTAYATQYMKNNTESFTPAEAWNNVSPTPVTP